MLLQHTEAKLGHLQYHNKTIERLFYNQPKYRLENILAMITSWRTCSICEKYEASVSMADLNGELSWERREKYLTQSVSNLIPAIPDPLFLVCSPFPNANKQFQTQIRHNCFRHKSKQSLFWMCVFLRTDQLFQCWWVVFGQSQKHVSKCKGFSSSHHVLFWWVSAFKSKGKHCPPEVHYFSPKSEGT